MRKVFSLVLLLVFCQQVHSAEYLEAVCSVAGYESSRCCDNFMDTSCPEYIKSECCRDNFGLMAIASMGLSTFIVIGHCVFSQHVNTVASHISCGDREEQRKKIMAARMVGGSRRRGPILSKHQQRLRKRLER